MANTTIIPISLPKELARKIDRVAKRQRMTRSEFVRATLRSQLAATERMASIGVDAEVAQLTDSFILRYRKALESLATK